MRAVLGMSQHLIPFFFSPGDLAELQRYVDIDTTHAIASVEDLDPGERAEVDTLITSWGGPEMTREVLDQLPSLRAIVHAAGTVRFVDPEAWRRGIVVSSGAWANAVPVATVINTARADIVDQDALIAELRSGRLRAVLDVTDPEVLPKDHILYTLPNVHLTPHLAGAAGNELRRLGSSAVAEVRRHVQGAPLKHTVEFAELARMA